MQLDQLLHRSAVRRYLDCLKSQGVPPATINRELLARSLRSTDQGRQNQKHHGQTHNRQGEIEKYQIIGINTHDRFLSKNKEMLQKNTVADTPNTTIDNLGLSIKNGTTTEATATWAKSAAIEANLSSWELVNNGALATISSKNFPINQVYHHPCN